MTRADIESKYQIVNGEIKDKGPFMFEKVYSPYFYELSNIKNTEGETGMESIDLAPEHLAEFPELSKFHAVEIWRSASGYIYCHPYIKN